MNRRQFVYTAAATAALGSTATLPVAQGQMPAAAAGASTDNVAMGPIGREKAASLVPATVFFAGRVAAVQARNTAGVKMGKGVVLVGLVDTSGYSSGVQEKYQAYLLLDAPAIIGGKRVSPGAYGCGMVGQQFLLLDLGANLITSLPAQHNEKLARPMPLQVIADSSPMMYQLYFGRTSVSITPAAS